MTIRTSNLNLILLALPDAQHNSPPHSVISMALHFFPCIYIMQWDYGQLRMPPALGVRSVISR